MGRPSDAETASHPEHTRSERLLSDMVVDWYLAPDEDGAASRIAGDAVTALGTIGAVAADLVMLRDRGRRLSGHGPTDGTAVTLAQVHLEYDDSPCRHALNIRSPVAIRTTVAETRWPDITARAAALNIAAMLCVPLAVTGRNIGALNLYAHTSGAFPDSNAEPITTFAVHAALALHVHAERRNLWHAVESRDRIGQAKGILMARHQLTPEQAFDHLVTASQAANMKLADTANWLIDNQQSTPSSANLPPPRRAR